MNPKLFSRRQWMQLAGAATTLVADPVPTSATLPNTVPSTGMGLVTYCCRRQRDQILRDQPSRDLFDPTNWLDHCRHLGAGGIQLRLGDLDRKTADSFRQTIEDAGMFVEAIVSVPYEKQDIDAFRSQLKVAAWVGAKVARTTIIPGRRYEYFDTLEQFKQKVARAKRALELAAPVAEQHQVAIAVENHKDQRTESRVALFEHISSEFVGACVDTGNSIALLEHPLDTAKALAPWAHTVHLKDQALDLYEDGFLLADTPLGKGSLDLPSIVQVLREAKPEIHFNLELITRDALQVPVFSDKYWATLPNFPASDLAKHLRFIQSHRSNIPDPVSQLSVPNQVAREKSNVDQSIVYAKEQLLI